MRGLERSGEIGIIIFYYYYTENKAWLGELVPLRSPKRRQQVLC
jgi:hypothetical protein